MPLVFQKKPARTQTKTHTQPQCSGISLAAHAPCRAITTKPALYFLGLTSFYTAHWGHQNLKFGILCSARLRWIIVLVSHIGLFDLALSRVGVEPRGQEARGTMAARASCMCSLACDKIGSQEIRTQACCLYGGFATLNPTLNMLPWSSPVHPAVPSIPLVGATPGSAH